MTTLYRIQYKILELGKTYSGTRIGSESMEEYAEWIRRHYLDQTLFHIELLEVIEKNDDDESESEGSLIILGLDLALDKYDTFLP